MDTTTTAPKITLAKTAPWATADEIAHNALLRNGYRERFALVEGRRFRLSADSLDAMWWVEEVEVDGQPTFGGERGCEIVSWCKWAMRLSDARRMIAEHVAQVG